MLSHPANVGRTLLLCYPDEGNSLALECLQALGPDVNHVVHVGELLQTGTLMDSPQVEAASIITSIIAPLLQADWPT